MLSFRTEILLRISHIIGPLVDLINYHNLKWNSNKRNFRLLEINNGRSSGKKSSTNLVGLSTKILGPTTNFVYLFHNFSLNQLDGKS
jgi:hypothetical protein